MGPVPSTTSFETLSAKASPPQQHLPRLEAPLLVCYEKKVHAIPRKRKKIFTKTYELLRPDGVVISLSLRTPDLAVGRRSAFRCHRARQDRVLVLPFPMFTGKITHCLATLVILQWFHRLAECSFLSAMYPCITINASGLTSDQPKMSNMAKIANLANLAVFGHLTCAPFWPPWERFRIYGRSQVLRVQRLSGVGSRG
jgi:hypothetical protein